MWIATVAACGWFDREPVAAEVSPAPVVFHDDPDLKGLRIDLTDLGSARPAADTVHRPVATPLGADAVDALLALVPPLDAPDGDRKPFAFPPGPKPPPLPGSDTATGTPVFGVSPPQIATAAAPRPLSVVRVTPDGDVPLAPELTVTFDQPMVSVTTQAAAADPSGGVGVPVALDPQPPGEWRWLGTRTLLFDPLGRLPMATTYTVRIPAGTRSALGGTLATESVSKFATPPPHADLLWPAIVGPLPNQPVLVVSFDQRVDPDAVVPRLSLAGAPGGPAAVRSATEAEIAADPDLVELLAHVDEPADHRVAVVPVAPLPDGANLRLVVAAGTPSAEGPRTTPADQRFDLRIHGRLALVHDSCDAGTSACPPDGAFRLEFSNPLAKATGDVAVPGLRVTPDVPGLRVEVYGDTIVAHGGFAGGTHYQFHVPASLADAFAQTLGEDLDLDFRTGHLDPEMAAPGGTLVTLDPGAAPVLPITTVNHADLVVTVARVTPDDWRAWNAYTRELWSGRRRPRLPGEQVHTGHLRPTGSPDVPVVTDLDLAPFLTEGTGQLVVLVEPAAQPRNWWERQYVFRWVQVTTLGLSVLVDREHLVGRATDLASGAPRAEVALTLRGAEPGTTDAAGLATLALPPPPPGDADDDPRVLVARSGSDVAILPESRSWGSAWVRTEALPSLRWYVADDRGVYRPGEHARVKGWLRRSSPGPDGDLGPLPASGVTVDWTLTSATGNPLGAGTSAVGAHGGFSLDLPIAEDAAIGPATLDLAARGVAGHGAVEMEHPLRIEAFRRPEFEVTAAVDADRRVLGETARLDVTAAYYAGGGLPDAPVDLTVTATPVRWAPPGWSDWTFGAWSPPWVRGPAPDDTPVDGGAKQLRTDPFGELHVGVHLDALNPAHPQTVRIEVGVQDVSRQTWSARGSFVVHPAAVAVGLKTGRAFVDPGEPVSVDVAVVDLDGKPATAAAEVVLSRITWAWSDGKPERKLVDPRPCTARPGADGRATCAFTPDQGGSYAVEAVVRDPLGRSSATELDLWVSGARGTPARNVGLDEVVLVPDHAEPRPGDVVRVLVQAPFWPAEGLLSVQRDGLARVEPFTMDGPTTTLTVPIAEAWIPDVTVQVDLVGSAERVDDHGNPRPDAGKRVAQGRGTLTLRVPPLSRTLAVAVTPAADAVAPGADTLIALAVTGPDGQPVADAEIAVVVADESVLALTDYALPDPLDVFYAARGPGVSDLRGRDSVVLADAPAVAAQIRVYYSPSGDGALGLGSKGHGAGGGGGGSLREPEAKLDDVVEYARSTGQPRPRPARKARAKGPMVLVPDLAVRTDFSALALFAPEVRTGADGRATVPLHLPDSLTRYRVMAVAVDRGGRVFGAGEAGLVARKTLMVRPSPPRFLAFGDQVELPVVVQNPGTEARTVDVAIRGANLRFVDAIGPSVPDLPDVAVSSAGRRVTVPAGDRVEVRFPAATVLPGTARLQVVAVDRSETGAADAATFDLPVWTPATTEAFAATGEIDGPGLVQAVDAPDDVWPQLGALEVTTSSTQLQALTDAVLYLERYPYEGTEPLASRVLAIAGLRDVLTAFDAEGLPPADALEATVRADLEQLAARQRYDGGFAAWSPARESWPYLSIHVANAFARARAKGYAVPESAFDRARSYLEGIEYRVEEYGPEEAWFLRAYALDVRRRMGDPDPAEAKRLLRQGGAKVGVDALAFLLPTLHEARATEAAGVVRRLRNAATQTASTAQFTTAYTDGPLVLLHSDRRTDAIVLEALLETHPDDPLVPAVVRGLLAHRTKGRWANPQENAFALLALDRYLATAEAATPDFVARAWLGDGYLGDHAFRGRTTERAHTVVPLARLTEATGPVPLVLARDGADGRLYYRIALTYAPRDLRLAPKDDGFAVARTYAGADDPADVRRDADGTWHIRAGSRVRVHLTMATPARRYHVALSDPLPAGLEPVNPVLAPSGTAPADPDGGDRWTRTWFEHTEQRDERVDAFASLVWEGAWDYDYVARATTPGRFVVAPPHAAEMYAPETFGRGATDLVIVE